MSVVRSIAELRDVRVFVVEDHAFQRGGLVSMLRAIGVDHIREASNGREALVALEDGRVPPADVILCDLEMPEMDGVEFLRAVAERKLARAVIVISGRELEILWSVEAMVRASGLEVLGKFQKPASPELLRRLLSRYISAVPIEKAPEAVLDAAALRRGLEAREFRCEFQPKVRLASGELVGVEALARWLPPGSAPVPPDVFVPEMVRAGLITPLTEQMLDSACAALTAWGAEGLKLGASVNVSMATLSDVTTADRFLAQVHAYGLEPQRITFEVTETEVMADVAAVLNVMARLRLKGFRLAIDDFGTGYSSLAQLNSIPFTELKIDQTFVRKCARAQRLRNIIQSCIELGQRLGVRTVAEGIEAESEWDFLRSVFCDEGQGYYIARPMPAAELPAWAARWLARPSA